MISLFWVFLPLYLQAQFVSTPSFFYAERDPLNRYYALSGREAAVFIITQEGIFKSGEGSSLLPVLRSPVGLQIQYPSSVWVIDRLSRSVIEFDMKLNMLGQVPVPSAIEEPGAFLILNDGRWIITDHFNEKIWQLIPGVQSPASWGSGPDLKIIPHDLQMIRLEGQSRRQVLLMSISQSAVWITDSRGLVIEKLVIPDSIKAENPAGGDNLSCFISGKSGTWRISSGYSPKKIFDFPVLRLWHDRAILKNGTLIPVEIKNSKPEGPEKR